MTAPIQTRQLTEAILDSGIQNTNFFNGRILNAGDLQADQDANRQQHEQLGLAIGPGVVRGLWVELVDPGSGIAAPVVSVSAGLAVNANGQAVALPVNIKLALVRQTTPLPADAGLFADCAPPSATTVPLQAGIYILVASPASGFSGQAPMFSFGDVTSATGCGSKYAVEGIRFRLVQLDVTQLARLSPATRDAIARPGSGLMAQTDPASLSKLRNWVAHICFGTEEIAGFIVDPFARAGVSDPLKVPIGQSLYVAYGAIDALVAAGTAGVDARQALTTGDVPLALLYWTNQGVQFLDRWSVRRRAVARPVTTEWPLPLSARRRAEAEAAFLQFEEQTQALLHSTLSNTSITNLSASAYFRYLPAAGLLPTTAGLVRGFSAASFFSHLTVRDPITDPVFMEGAKLASLLRESLEFSPIDLTSKEHIWLYGVRENQQAIDSAGNQRPQAYIAFTNGQMSYRGDARFDLMYVNYSNYA
jgi:hypothetical protein